MRSFISLFGCTVTSLFCLGAQAQTACPADTTVGTVMTAGYACVLGDKTFSAFDITGAPANARIQFGILNNELFAVTMSRDGTFFGDGRLVFDYTVTPMTPLTIREGSVGVDVSFPTVLTSTTMNGLLLGPIVNGGTEVMTFTPGVVSLVVDNTLTISGPAELNSVSNDFSQEIIGIPEPGTLVLFAGGLFGLLLRRER
jgi:hypothetical protein